MPALQPSPAESATLALEHLPLGVPLGLRFGADGDEVPCVIRLGAVLVDVPGALYDAWVALRGRASVRRCRQSGGGGSRSSGCCAAARATRSGCGASSSRWC